MSGGFFRNRFGSRSDKATGAAAAPASAQHKPSWASLSSTVAPSAANTWDVDAGAPSDAPHGTLNIPAGLGPAAAPASAQYKPSWASLSSTVAPSAANTWDVDAGAPSDAPHGTFNIPAGLGPVALSDEQIAAENARLEMENEMLRLQCLQAQAAAVQAVQAAMVAPGLLNDGGGGYPAMSSHEQLPSQAPEQRPQASSSSVKSPPSGEVEVPQVAAAEEPAPEATGDAPEGPKTTVMIRNLPNNMSRAELMKLLDSEGFELKYDFIYLPKDFKSGVSLGYAFVNLTTPEDATRFWDKFEGYSSWSLPSTKVSSVNWSMPHQGLDANVEHFRNSPVMHDSVPDENRPILLQNGERVQFPAPTKKIRAPRVRAAGPGEKIEKQCSES